jgi:hypothetical protein
VLQTAGAHIAPITGAIKTVSAYGWTARRIAPPSPHSAPRHRSHRPPARAIERPIPYAPHRFPGFASGASQATRTRCNGQTRKVAPRQGTGFGALTVGSNTPSQSALWHSATADRDCSVFIAQAPSGLLTTLSLEAQLNNCERSNAPHQHRHRDDNSTDAVKRFTHHCSMGRADVAEKRHHMRTV